MSVEERSRLIDDSVDETDDERNPRRWTMRREANGLEFFELKLTRALDDGRIEVHGHPTRRVPPKILRKMRQMGRITEAEYERLRKELC